MSLLLGASILEPAGPAAERVASLWPWLLWASVVAVVVVVVLMAVSMRRRGRLDGPVDSTEPRWGVGLIIIAGVAVPFVVLAATYVLSLVQMRELASGGDEAEITIEVIGRTWWWEVRYPNGATTANEIHIPAGEPVMLELTSADVIHSFWVPELQVKVDQVPGRTNELWIEAAEPGRFRGQCAEYCGLQHANMIVQVVAEEPEEFERWLDEQAAPAADPAGLAAEGRDVFMSTTCIGCHTIGGTQAQGDLGPDLTHLASRDTLAAGVMDNTAENLAQLVTDPQSVKPGMIMPPTQLTDEQTEALVAYLMELE